MSERTGFRPVNTVSEFVLGMRFLARGFGFWRDRPGLMALGLLPGAIVGAALITLLVLLGVFLDPVTEALTFFAAGWDPAWRRVLRILVAAALLVGLLALTARVFTALALVIGTPFYDRIAAAVEHRHGAPPTRSAGSWSTTLDYWSLIAASFGIGILLALLGLVPVIGTVAAAVLGFVLTARALAIELTVAPLAARGLSRSQRRRALRGRRARALGFGVAVQLCYLVPFGAILTMPAAVAGGVLLARDTLGEPIDR